VEPDEEPMLMLSFSVRVSPRVEKVRVEPGELGRPVVDWRREEKVSIPSRGARREQAGRTRRVKPCHSTSEKSPMCFQTAEGEVC